MGKKVIDFDTLEDAIGCYGRENLVAIDNLKQAILYIKCGCQPRFVWEKENYPGKVTFWFLKDETLYIYKRWKNDCTTKK